MCLPPSAISPETPVAWPPGAASTVTDLDGPVRHLDLGGPVDAPVVLCVHGLGGSALNWGLLAPLLSDSHRIDGHTASQQSSAESRHTSRSPTVTSGPAHRKSVTYKLPASG